MFSRKRRLRSMFASHSRAAEIVGHAHFERRRNLQLNVCFSLQSSGNSWPRPLRKEKKSSVKRDVLIDPSQVSVVGPVDLNQSTASATSSTNVSLDDSSFKKELTDLKDEWSTGFARIEALLTMGSNPISAQPVSAVGHVAPVFSLVKVKVFHPPPYWGPVFFTLFASYCFLWFPGSRPTGIFCSSIWSPGLHFTSGKSVPGPVSRPGTSIGPTGPGTGSV